MLDGLVYSGTAVIPRVLAQPLKDLTFVREKEIHKYPLNIYF
jgi:hypothetical protein